MSPEADVLQLLLDGQRSIDTKLTPMSERLVRVEEQVKSIVDQRQTAQNIHDDCRQEMHRLFAQNESAHREMTKQNEADHSEMTRRVGSLESDRLVRTGKNQGASFVWKVFTAILGGVSLCLGIIIGILGATGHL